MTRHVTQQGLEFIKQFEGFSADLYICPAGYPTIGYGHVLSADETFIQSISTKEAELLLLQDVAKAERSVLRLIDVPLTDGQFDALCSFTLNLGGGALQRSTLRRCVNRQHHDHVPAQFMRWVWAGGRKLNGLIRRRKAEAIRYGDG